MSHRHAAIEEVVDGRRECRVCGYPVVGFGASLRHEGEAIPVLVPAEGDAPAVDRAVAIAHAVARRLPDAEPQALAEAVTRELYGAGLIRRNRGPRRGTVVLVEEGERVPDHAERAAGERDRVPAA